MSDKQRCSDGVHSYVEEYRVVLPVPGVWVRSEKLAVAPYVIERRSVCERCGATQESTRDLSRHINPFDLPPDVPKFRDFDGSF